MIEAEIKCPFCEDKNIYYRIEVGDLLLGDAGTKVANKNNVDWCPSECPNCQHYIPFYMAEILSEGGWEELYTCLKTLPALIKFALVAREKVGFITFQEFAEGFGGDVYNLFLLEMVDDN